MAKSSTRAKNRYAKDNTTRVVLQLNNTYDLDIIEELEEHSNKAGYIKRLIRQDMECRGISTLKELKHHKPDIQKLAVKGFEFIGPEVCRETATGRYFFHAGGNTGPGFAELTEDEAWHRAFHGWKPSNRIYADLLKKFGRTDDRPLNYSHDIVTAVPTSERQKYTKRMLPDYSIVNPRRDEQPLTDHYGRKHFITEDGIWYTCDDDGYITYPAPGHLDREFGDEWRKYPSIYTEGEGK